MTRTEQRTYSPENGTSARVADRTVVSEPNRVIQVERVTVSRDQQSAVTAAIRTGRSSKRSE
jgi:hypothetical protein